ncbi:LysR family transcriptional regulator [Clostridium sp. JS66]|uniref:LysR family transcriptional regulator n=1 Tax=Clostridium sp. JS66 TaxID=3064705 RepID=UPI00298E7335|nr:LysR family transcriptional regulator [Clostridium sp. JS66]WPC40019.1 LysR family transcriptional regulator [Clostridium sp. JS66]
MNYDFYKTFVVLAETKNFSKTAEKLNIVQSTVSNRIQELEKYLDIDLFYRTNKSVSLTQSGLYFLPYAKRIVTIEEEGLSALNNLNYKNTLKIGTVHSLYSGYVKKVAKKFMKLRPDISLEITINHTPNLLEMLSDNLIDIGFVFTLPKLNKFICLNKLKDEIILVAKNSTDFKDELLVKELKNIPLLYADTGDNFIEYVENELHCKLDFQFSIDQVLEIVEYLHDGLGYSFVLKSLVCNSIENGYLKEVKIKNTPSCFMDGYVMIEQSNTKKEVINSFFKLLSE